MLIGYIKKTNSPEKNQHCHDVLVHAGCEKIIEETVDNKQDQTTMQNRLLSALKQGDTLVVWKLDQLVNDFKPLAQLLLALNKQGIYVKSLQDGMDTTSAIGRFFFYVSGSFLGLNCSSKTP